jgi:undecaprenyl diphosphate synthase
MHIFIIPDGNRRWANENNFPQREKHKKGMEIFKTVAREIWTLKVSHFTFWGLSRDNFYNRDSQEISFLTFLLKNMVEEFLKSGELEKEKIYLRVIGRWKEFFDKELAGKIDELESRVACHKNGNKNLTLLLGYNGDDELVDAVNQLRIFTSDSNKISWRNIRNFLWTRFLPDIDIMIRTGYEPHLSAGALMMQMKDAHLYFPQMHRPEFSIDELKKIISDFKNRKRRYGK